MLGEGRSGHGWEEGYGNAGREAGRTRVRERERERDRETMMSAFPSGLVTWSLPGKQTGNRLHKGSLLGEAAAMASPFRLCSILSKQVSPSEPR